MKKAAIIGYICSLEKKVESRILVRVSRHRPFLRI